jgi:membrane protease YdiL (CAAX protease family)
MLTVLLLINCGVVAAFMLLSGATPYSGNQWLLTEVAIVPVVEELAWRGVLLSTVLAVLNKAGVGGASSHVAVWATGIAFGMLHLGNALAGVPLGFAVVQAASAVVWGVMYGYARTSTDSVLPAIGLHAAMNLVVVLLG